MNFQVMRHTHASLMCELEVDAKLVADQLGYSLDANPNMYRRTELGRRTEAVETLESAVRVM